MSPSMGVSDNLAECGPRASGDEPIEDLEGSTIGKWSPRERG